MGELTPREVLVSGVIQPHSDKTPANNVKILKFIPRFYMPKYITQRTICTNKSLPATLTSIVNSPRVFVTYVYSAQHSQDCQTQKKDPRFRGYFLLFSVDPVGIRALKKHRFYSACGLRFLLFQRRHALPGGYQHIQTLYPQGQPDHHQRRR